MYKSSDSEIEDAFVLQLFNEEHQKVENFESRIENYTDEQFRCHFRLSRKTVQLVVDKYTDICNADDRVFVNVTPKNRVYIFLWYLANCETFRQIGDRFGFTRSHAYDIIVELALFMANESRKLVKWPSLEQQKHISAGFKLFANIDHIIGAIDCTHIEIPRPKRHPENYFNRKKFHSLQMQATVDYNKKFTSVFVGEPGSMHDERVLRQSKLFKHLCERQGQIVIPKGFLLGDFAYPKTYTWLVPPFKINQGMSSRKKQFNKRHAKSRTIIKQAFGLLKTRFRRLQKFGNINKKLIILLVLSACALHNLCKDHDDQDIRDDTCQIENQSDSFNLSQESRHNHTTTRQDELFLELIEKNIIN